MSDQAAQRALADAARRRERERWTLSYTQHGATALRLRALAAGNGKR